jgi:glycosyltransferase involved in cell wall biosynthesis
MRVGWVVDGDLEQISGGYLYDRIVIDDLRRHGVDVDVVSIPPARYLARLAGRGRRALEERLAGPGFDIIVEDELSHPSLIRANARLERTRPRTVRVALVHHLRSSEPAGWPARRIFRLAERSFLQSVGAFIFNSRTTKAVVQDAVGGARPSIVAFPGADRLGAGIDPAGIKERAAQAGALNVLFVGNVIERKGLHTLIEALARLGSGTASLTITGRDDLEPAYAERVRVQIHRLGLGDTVRWTGPVGPGPLAALMEGCHVLAVPSTYEGYGMAYIEGMGRGLPAVAGRQGGAAEFIREGENGFLIDPGDSAALAAALLSLAADRARLRQMSLAALETYRSHPTWSETGATIAKFLADLTAVDRSPLRR